MKQNEIKSLLPGVFQRTTATPENPINAILAVMEDFHAPSEDILGRLEEYFNPYLTPSRFVPFLAGWVDLQRLLVEDADVYDTSNLPPYPAGTERLRDLIATASELARWRGTLRGLKGFLETATGVDDFGILEEPEGPDHRPQPFHMTIRIPAAGKPYRALIERIIRMEKPAYMTYDILEEG